MNGPCQCQTCLSYLTTEPVNSFDYEFQRMLSEGRVKHIGTNPDGRAIYKLV
jgi:hypothetical protein